MVVLKRLVGLDPKKQAKPPPAKKKKNQTLKPKIKRIGALVASLEKLEICFASLAFEKLALFR